MSPLRPLHIESRALRQSAEQELCTLQIVGVCRHDRDTTVLAHLPDESGGISRKSDDISAAYACDTCHAVIDGRRPWPEDEKPHRERYLRRAMVRTWRRMLETGVLTIRGLDLSRDEEGF